MKLPGPGKPPLRRNDIPSLQDRIRAVHQCESHHVRSVHVRETAGDKLFDGIVEVFDLTDCAAAPRAYAWEYREGSDVYAKIVLELPPVISPQSAVRGWLARRE